MSVQEGLSSTDAAVIKLARGVARGKVTKSIKALKNALVCENGCFVHDEIDADRVKEHYEKLNSNHEEFQELHERYLQFAVMIESTEALVMEFENNYSTEVSTEVSVIARLYLKYVKSKKEKSEVEADAKQCKKLENSIRSQKEALQSELDTARTLLVSEDDYIKKTAKSVKRDIRSCYESYDSKVNELLEFKLASEDVEEKYSTIVDDRSTIVKEVKSLCMELEAIAIQSGSVTTSDHAEKSVVKLQKLTCPKFSGIPRDFGHFKRDFDLIVNVPGRSDVEIGSNLKDAIPEKHKHLVSHLDTSDHVEMMSILEKKFGSKILVIQDIVSQLEKMKAVTSDRMFIEFVEKLQKIELDLDSLGQTGEIANATCMGKIEKRLPLNISTDWCKLVIKKKLNERSSLERFQALMKFLDESKERVEYQTTLSIDIVGSVKTTTNCVSGSTTLAANTGAKKKKERLWNRCLACDVDGATDLRAICHPMETCSVWNSLSQREKERKVKCLKHPFKIDHTTSECTVSGKACKFCSQDSHHFLLCAERKVNSSSNAAKISSATAQTNRSSKLATLVQAQYVSTPHGGKVGSLLDLCSTDDYVTHKYAKKNKLCGEPVELEVEGIGGNKSYISSKLYIVPILVEGKVKEIPCYGLETISSVSLPPVKESYYKMCAKFGVAPNNVKRPSSIDLLISMRQNDIHPSKSKSIGKMVLYDGPLGKVFGGCDPDLDFSPFVNSYPASVHPLVSDTVQSIVLRAVVKEAVYTTPSKTEKDFLEFFKEESIGVECSPRCGGCLCGKCATGSKQMSLKDEKEYEHFRSLMVLDEEGSKSDPGPYWVTKQPWLLDKNTLVNNKPAVLGVMNSTMKKLNKEPQWRNIYECQLLDLIDRGFAREVSEAELDDWIWKGGACYYISHQVAVNPTSKSTPVRVVFNSSQKFKGHSLNSSWALGPDMLNSLHGVLFRFREDHIGGQGDIKKMYYMIRIAKEEQFMQLFLWQFPGDAKVRTFCMQRLVMGNKPSGALSMVAMRETAELGENRSLYPAAYETLVKNSYVDNVFRVAPTIETLKDDINQIEKVSAMGGFYFKDWIISGEDVPEQLISVQLPYAIGVEEERCLGVSWDVRTDRLFVKSNLDKPGKKIKKTDIEVIVTNSDLIRIQVKPHLTIRACLSLHAKPYDPLGFVLPTKMIGNLLFRDTIQFMKREQKGKIPWDEAIENVELRKRWFEYFEMLLFLDEIKFERCIKPYNVNSDIDPILITFNDGNPSAFGVVAYALFELNDQSENKYLPSLLMSKAKLAPLTHLGETYRNELCGATLASRLKTWIIRESNLAFKDHIHFLDSMIVHEMMKKSSYGFNTFAGLRVGEIQAKTNVEDWRHIASAENVADCLTKGLPPNKLGSGSTWQRGPNWLSQPSSTWPVTADRSDRVPSDEIEEEMSKFYRKTSISLCSNIHSQSDMENPFDLLIRKCSTLQQLVRLTALLLRWPGRACSQLRLKQEIPGAEVTAREYQDAFKFLVYFDQSKRLFMKKGSRLITRTVTVNLELLNLSYNVQCLSGRVKNFPVSFSSNADIPVLPYSKFAELIVLYHHNRIHRDIDTIVAAVRQEFWPIKVRKIAAKIDSKCLDCKLKRGKFEGQIMGDLPEFRSEMLPAFSVVAMDLFGPWEVKDDVILRGPKKFRKIWGVVYTCTSTRAVYLDVAIDYSTESILHTVRRLMAFRGDVRLIISDPGSQLVGASKELKNWRNGWNQEELEKFGADKGLEWRFIGSNSQHQNGVTESIVKMVKGVQKSMLRVIGDTKLSLNETFTLMAEICNLLNERPIGLMPTNKSCSDYISPNSLLLGRSTGRIMSGPFQSLENHSDDPKQFQSRFVLVQSIVDQFWKVWMKWYFPTLMLRQKWHIDRRNVSAGDVCVLKDANAYRGEWRMCKVTRVFPDNKGKVRNVEVMVKPRQGGSGPYTPSKPIYLTRHVCNLIVIVPVDEE